MADSNNIPQEAQQLKEDLSSQDEETSQEAKSKVAKTNFDKEYKIAQQNTTGSDASSQGSVDNIDSPGDSDPDDYLDMAKEVTKGAEADK